MRALYPDLNAFGPDDDREPRSLSALRRILTDIHHNGYATELGEVTPGLASSAMAVFDPHGYPVAAVAVTYPEGDHTSELFEAIAREVRTTARLLSRRFGDPKLAGAATLRGATPAELFDEVGGHAAAAGGVLNPRPQAEGRCVIRIVRVRFGDREQSAALAPLTPAESPSFSSAMTDAVAGLGRLGVWLSHRSLRC